MDNAASKVAEHVAQKLNADHDPKLPLHDPAHCIDLLSKDLAKSSVVRSVLAEAKEVFDLWWTSQIDSIRKEAIDAGDILASIVARNVCETHMNLTYIHLKSALAQSTFIASLLTNDRYIKYYVECSSARKQELDGILQNCNHGRWQRMLMLIDLAKVFTMLTGFALVMMLNWVPMFWLSRASRMLWIISSKERMENLIGF